MATNVSDEPVAPSKAPSAPAAGGEAEALLDVARAVSAELHPRWRHRRPVTLDSSLDRDLGLDSLGRAELLSRLDKTFAVALPESLVATAESPRDLLRALERSRTASPAAATPHPVVQPGATPAVAPAELPLAEVPSPGAARTLVEVLDGHARHHPERRHILFLPPEGGSQELTYGDLWQRARQVAAGLQELGVEPADTVGLLLPTSLEYFAAFFGALLCGAVPVPLYPPVRRSQLADHLRRQARILATARVRVLVAFPEVRPLARLLRAQVVSLQRVVTVAELAGMVVGEPRLPVVREGDVALLQFTSGSTADPKGVVLTHSHLLANLRAIDASIGLDAARDVVVSWLPLYHDMGLIGAWLGSLTYAMPLVLLSPISFLTRPSRWLWALHHHRATLSAAPNFGYELCIGKVEDGEIEGLDLSSVRGLLNGAEPVSAETLRRFAGRFSRHGLRPGTLMPVYGLAENALALTFPPPGREPVVDAVDREALAAAGRAVPAPAGAADALRFVGCGFPLPGNELRIVDDAGAEVEERRQGHVQFRGPSATSGYLRNPQATRRLFHGSWLDSGDLGYLAGGELFITGRAKDLIIRAGRNVYPQELEEAVGELPGVRKGCVAVFGTADPAAGTERLVILAEARELDEEGRARLEERIQELAGDLVGTPADEVVLAPPRTVPKTSSGKLRRAAARQLYERGRLGRRRPVWWQLAGLAWAGARPQLTRARRSAGELLYAGWFWLVVGLATLPVTALLVLLPRLTRRRRLARQAGRQVALLTAIPLRVSGLEHLQGPGPFIVAANHASYLDGFALTAALPTAGAFLAKEELRRSFLARLLLERLGTLFVDRFDPERGIEDTARAVDAVERGESLLFFPEGTFHRTPGLQPFRLGAFYVAVRTGVPVVPVAIRGSRSLLRGGEWLPRRTPVTVTVCPPVSPRGSDLAAAATLRDEVRAAILDHCGEPDLAAE